MGTVIFTAEFTGGAGTLDISVDGGPTKELTDDTPYPLILPAGDHTYQVSGAASPGPGGGATLNVDGDVITDTPLNWGPGPILPELHDLLVTV